MGPHTKSFWRVCGYALRLFAAIHVILLGVATAAAATVVCTPVACLLT